MARSSSSPIEARNEAPAAKCAPRSTVIVSKFPGQCACGEKFSAGASVAWSKSYEHPITGCSACDFGTFPGMSAASLREDARSWMNMANNAMNARLAKNVGRCLTRNTLAVNASRDGRA
jgi:hypothetical protein